MENFSIKHKKLFLVIAVLTAAAVINPDIFFGFISSAVSVLKPVFIGMTLAFIINRPVCRIYEIFLGFSDKINEKSYDKAKPFFLSRTKTGVVCKNGRSRKLWYSSVTAVYLLILAAIAGAVWIIIPQVAGSLRTLTESADLYREKFMIYYRALEKRDTLGILPLITSAVKKLSDRVPGIIADAYGKTAYFIALLADIVIGIVISVYILAGKEKLRVIVRKTAKKLVSPEIYARCADLYRTVYDIFSRFVSGQIAEAAILGVLCFIGMKLFRFEYAMLISTIIGITALIPVMGAIIGTVPCAFLLFLVKPVSAVWFIVYIIVLQQLENNFIYPKIVGKSMGLPPLLVLLAIILGAKIGGGAGILLAVPLTAVAYGIFKEKILEE